MVRIQVRFTEEQASFLIETAKRQGKSHSDLVREIVDTWIPSNSSPTLEQRQRAIAAVGKLRSGLSDLSERHDQYFVESIDP